MSKIKEQNYTVELFEIGGVAWDEAKPTEDEIKKAMIDHIKTKIDLMGIDQWLENSIVSIKKAK